MAHTGLWLAAVLAAASCATPARIFPTLVRPEENRRVTQPHSCCGRAERGGQATADVARWMDGDAR